MNLLAQDMKDLQFDDSNINEVTSYTQAQLSQTTLNEDGTFYIPEESSKKVNLKKEKNKYVSRYEESSLERFKCSRKSKSPITNVTAFVADNWSRENSYEFMEKGVTNSVISTLFKWQNMQKLVSEMYHAYES